ncbi:YueI family protein [Latilactobacillus curvatus]|uniref:YueI family protein n=1 Tax=Latilactobacillus curvatus TaxID=28038 RepID=UPI0008151A48|nr:YueI family protein [Latilactobacillus curvatus]ANY13752.1 hypothetical protein BCY75_07045 [Latilactobacillus curvatus]MBZ1504542.1 YueI family protein [Latilactobacillus curvatus]MCM0724816.1 YueI family protein [Latilactobacillus curvatus]MCP8848356.1 YueI family protein [Latilactobacillus curvatus]MCP8864492.1 YueI family protein [Latilactobacillus curvatus]
MSDNDQLQQHLDSAMHGAPQTNPDERRRYLGSLRERVFLGITNQELATAQAKFEAHLTDYKPYSVLLNGKNPAATDYLVALSAHGIPFTLVNNETAKTEPTAFGLLVVAKDAINHEAITLDTLYPDPKTTTQDAPTKKGGFLKHLFD